MATAPTESSTSCRAPALSVTTSASWSRRFGNFYQTNDQINCGGHTERFAYYASVNGNRSNYGLQTPIAQVFHDAENGYGGFASFIFNPDPSNQFRLVTSLRQDYYQIPYRPGPQLHRQSDLAKSGESPSYGLRDGEREPRRLRHLLLGPHLQSPIRC